MNIEQQSDTLVRQSDRTTVRQNHSATERQNHRATVRWSHRRTVALSHYAIALCYRTIALFMLLCCTTALLLFSETEAATPSTRYFSYPDYTRIVIETSQEVIFSTGSLSEPERIFIDINQEMRVIQKEFDIKDSIVKRIRTGFPQKGLTRIVIDLNGKADYMVFPLYEPFRIVIDVIAKRSEDMVSKTGQIDANSEQGSQQIIAPRQGGDSEISIEDATAQRHPKKSSDFLGTPQRTFPSLSKKPRVVIDPGHGGHDPGAIGKNGLKEKDVNLDIALKVKEILKDEFEIFMTREKDVFISLDERTAFANSKNADLFVSIHTNSNRKKNINGIETYFLNWTDDEEALKVAARENGISLKAMKNFSNFIDLIKMDLEAQAKREDSMKLAATIHGELKENLDRPSNGIKKGPFYVLYTAKMPCVLLEVSYISNPLEERLLSTSAYREKLAGAIAKGIRRYFERKNQLNHQASKLAKDQS